MFQAVSATGVQAVYKGIVVKRRPLLTDFITLQSGQSVVGKVNLLKGYWFPVDGEYKITLNTFIHTFIGELDFNEVTDGLQNFEIFDLISSDDVAVKILAVASAPNWGSFNDTLLGAVTPAANCDSSRVTQIRTSDTNAGTLITRVVGYIRGTCPSGNYVTWMGACDASRYATVQRNFNAIQSRHSAGYRADCAGSSCSANIYAYVYPADTTYTVYVCGAFWNAPIGTCNWDSKPGTIIHELSHFNSVAGTSDIAYGTTACQNLARTNPSQAIRNADNHEYLAESCP